MSERINLVVDDGVADMMTALAKSERKRGEWLSKVVRVMYEQNQQIEATDTEALRLTVMGLAGQVKGIDARLTRVEQGVTGAKVGL